MASVIRKFYEFNGLRFDAQTHCLKRGDELVQLPPKSLDALAVLLENRGDVVSRETLLDAVWEESYVDDANLTVAVSALRKTLSTYTGAEDHIQTISRKGYRFTADVDEKIELRDEPIVVSRHTKEELTYIGNDQLLSTANRTKYLRPLMAIGLMVIVAVGALFGYRTWGSRATPPTAKSLAVLPVKNLTGDANNDFLVDGVTESVITEIAKVQGLKVIARNSTFALKENAVDLKSIGEKLGVTHLLDGSIRRDGDLLRLETRLINAATGEIVWSGTFERKMEEVLTVQDGIACSVSGELRAALCGEKDSDPKKYQQNLKAYQAYLKGRFYWYKRGTDPLHQAVAEFEKALQCEPNYAPALAALAETYVVMETNGVILPGAGIPKAIMYAEKAISVDPTIPGSYAALGIVRSVERKPQEAELMYSKAIEINPNYSLAWQWRSTFYSSHHRFAEAEAGLKKAQELDPLSLSINYALGNTYLNQRDYERTMAQGEHLLSIFPENFAGYQLISAAYDGMGRYDEALAAAEKAHPINVEMLKALILCHSGRRDEALQMISKIEGSEISKNNPYGVASLYAALGDRETSLAWLNKAIEINQSGLTEINVDRDFDAMRSDSRFVEIVRRSETTN
ncbi:N/A [soil metagenome]